MAENPEVDRDISLSEIFWRLWAGRGIIVLVPLIAIGLAALYVALSILSQSHPVTYLVKLRNIENQHYPNGTAFSPQDLLVPEVLSGLRQRFDIPSEAKLREAITVNYDSPVASGISQSYQRQLSARNLSPAEITALNQSYLEELRAATQSSLRINVDYMALGVDAQTGLAIARALPDTWTTVYTTKFRIFTDRRIADLAVTRTNEDFSTTASILVAGARASGIQQGLDLLLSDNRLAMLQTSEGISPADVELELRRFLTIWFNPIRASRFKSDDVVANAYLTELRLDIKEKNRQIAAYDTTLASLREYMHRGQVPPQFTEQQNPIDRNTVQIGETALSEIVQLAEQASFAAFVQDTLRNRQQALFDVSKLMKEHDLLSGVDENVSTSREFRLAAAEQLATITGHYSGLVATAADQLRDRGAELYEPSLGPMIAAPSPLSMRNLLIILAAGLAGGLLAVIGTLSWSSIRPRTS